MEVSNEVAQSTSNDMLFGSDDEDEVEKVHDRKLPSDDELFGSDDDEQATNNDNSTSDGNIVSDMKSQSKDELFGSDDGDDDNEKVAEPQENGLDDILGAALPPIPTVLQIQKSQLNLAVNKSIKLPEASANVLFKIPNSTRFQVDPYTCDHDSVEEKKQFGSTDTIGSVMRWRNVGNDANGLPLRESNTRLVKWSDGTFQLVIGDTVFNISSAPLNNSFAYVQSDAKVMEQKEAGHDEDLDQPADNGQDDNDNVDKTQRVMQCIGEVNGRMTAQMSSLRNATHARITSSITSKYKTEEKIHNQDYELMPLNPLVRQALAAKEEDKLLRQKHQQLQRSNSGHYSTYANSRRPSMSANYLNEPAGDYDTVNLSDLKNSRRKPSGSRHQDDENEMDGFIVNDDPDNDDDDDDDSESNAFAGRRPSLLKKKQPPPPRKPPSNKKNKKEEASEDDYNHGGDDEDEDDDEDFVDNDDEAEDSFDEDESEDEGPNEYEKEGMSDNDDDVDAASDAGSAQNGAEGGKKVSAKSDKAERKRLKKEKKRRRKEEKLKKAHSKKKSSSSGSDSNAKPPVSPSQNRVDDADGDTEVHERKHVAKGPVSSDTVEMAEGDNDSETQAQAQVSKPKRTKRTVIESDDDE